MSLPCLASFASLRPRAALVLLTAVSCFAACGDLVEPGPCAAICSCLASMSDTPSATRSECVMECHERVEQGVTVDECRAEVAARGFPECSAKCDRLEPEHDSSDGGAEDEEASEVPQCSGSGCPESKTSRRDCHSDCNFSGYCWDVCETVWDYRVDNAVCTDGLDNDSDGLIDCDDPECREEASVCRTPSGGSDGGAGVKDAGGNVGVKDAGGNVGVKDAGGNVDGNVGVKDAGGNVGGKDAGERDAGSKDAGSEHAGSEDAGSKDAGSKDAGGDGGVAYDANPCTQSTAGIWCGGNLLDADPDRLFLCSGATLLGSVHCPNGCHASVFGVPDYCEDGAGTDPCINNTFPEARTCGSDLAPYAKPNTLYHCVGQTTVDTTDCTAGCSAVTLSATDLCYVYETAP